MCGICLPRCSGKCSPYPLLRWLDWVWGFHHSPYNTRVHPLIPSGALCLHKSIWHYLALASSRPWAGTRTGWNVQHPLLWVSLSPSLPPWAGEAGEKGGSCALSPVALDSPRSCHAAYLLRRYLHTAALGGRIASQLDAFLGVRSLWSRARRHGEGKHIGVRETKTEKEISGIVDPH